MPLTDNPDLTIIVALWDALEAYALFTQKVKIGNRIKRQDKEGQQALYLPDGKAERQGNDLSEVDIDIAAFSVIPQMRTFGNCVSNQEHKQTFEITITTDELGVAEATAVKTATIDALSAAGQTLNIPKTTLPVVGWSVPYGTSTIDRRAGIPGIEESSVKRKIKLGIQVTYRRAA